MRITVVVVLFLACLEAAGAKERVFNPLKERNPYSLLCPCEFAISRNMADEDSFGIEEWVFAIAPNEAKPFARINLGKGDMVLTPVGKADYECKKGEVYSSKWKAGDVLVSAKLTVRGPGAEACWFAGTLNVKSKAISDTIRVKGVCGC